MEEIMEVVVEETLENAVEEATQDAVSSSSNSGTGMAMLIGAVGAVATIYVVSKGVKLAKRGVAAYKNWKNNRAEAAELAQEPIEVDFEESSEEESE